jgi:hypothetical protein
MSLGMKFTPNLLDEYHNNRPFAASLGCSPNAHPGAGVSMHMSPSAIWTSVPLPLYQLYELMVL